MARKSKFSEAQIIGAIKECEAGAVAKDVARKMGVSYETLNRWKAKYGGMTVTEAQDKRRIEDENGKLKKRTPCVNRVLDGGRWVPQTLARECEGSVSSECAAVPRSAGRSGARAPGRARRRRGARESPPSTSERARGSDHEATGERCG